MALTKVKASNIILTTAAASSNDTTPATTQYVTTAINNLIDGAPATLNTLDEIAAALNDDAALNTTLTNAIAAKLPLAGGTLTGNLGVGITASSAIGIYHSQSLANGLAAELTNTQSSTGSGIVVKGGSSSSNYSADFRDYNNNSLMRVRGDGNVGIGETNPLGTLHVKSTDSGATADGSADDLVVENNSNTGISILSGTASSGSIYFGDSDRNWDGYIAYSHGSSPSMTIASNGGSNYIKLDDTGHVGLSTTPTAWGSGYKSLQIGARGFVGAHSGSDLYVGQNAYHNSGWKYEAGVAASLTQHSGGQIGHYIAPVGSAGGSITWNAALFIDTNSKTTLTRTVNGSGSTDYANILEISRIGGATSNAQREAAISFFDSANSTYTAMITGVRTAPAGNYDGGLSIYTNNHADNGNATSISEMVTGKVAHFAANKSTILYGGLSVTATTSQIKGGFGSNSTSGTLDWNHSSNARSGMGETLLLGNATNGPGGNLYYHIMNYEYISRDGTGNITQHAIPYYGSSTIYSRIRYQGNWSSWGTV